MPSQTIGASHRLRIIALGERRGRTRRWDARQAKGGARAPAPIDKAVDDDDNDDDDKRGTSVGVTEEMANRYARTVSADGATIRPPPTISDVPMSGIHAQLIWHRVNVSPALVRICAVRLRTSAPARLHHYSDVYTCVCVFDRLIERMQAVCETTAHAQT